MSENNNNNNINKVSSTATTTIKNQESTAPSNEQSDLLEPEKIGDFIVGKTMGRGTFGKVKLGTHTSCHQDTGQNEDKRFFRSREDKQRNQNFKKASSPTCSLIIRLDFGLGNLYSAGTMLKTACGSPCYAAPEMTKGQIYHGLLTDIWSSGVVLFVMVSGQLPFQDRNTNKLYQKIQTADYKMPDQLSDACKDFIKRVLVPDWSQRYRIEDIRAHPWYNLIKATEKDGILLDRHEIQIDEKILARMERDYKLNIDKARQEVKLNKFTSNTTIYYLLLKRHERVGILRQQFQVDLQKKKPKVNVQMILEQQNQLQQDNQPISIAPLQLTNQREESKKIIKETQQIQAIEINKKPQRVEHSTDVNRSQMHQIIKPSVNVNFMSTINQDMIVQQQQQQQLQQNVQHQQAQVQLIDPFSKVNNPKARQLIQNLDRSTLNKINVSQERRGYDSTGGSEHVVQNIEASQVSNARNQQNTSGQYNLPNQNSINKQQQDSINRSFQNGSTTMNFANQTQTGFYSQNQSAQPQQKSQMNSGRQQIPSPSYQNYLFSEKLTPSHYRSPIQINQLFTPGNPVIGDDKKQYIKTSSLRQAQGIHGQQVKHQNGQKQQEIISNLISQVSSSSTKYRSASRSHEQNQQQHGQLSNKITKKSSLNTGLNTPSMYGKIKTQGLMNQTTTIGSGSNTTKMNKNMNSSFQDAQHTFTNFNQTQMNNTNNMNADSIDIDLYLAPNSNQPNILGKTQINFAKSHNQTMQNSRMGMHTNNNNNNQQKKYSPQPHSGRQNSPQNPANLSFQIGQPNQTIIIRNPPSSHHMKHNSYSGGTSSYGTSGQNNIININQMMNDQQNFGLTTSLVGSGGNNNTINANASGGMNLKKFMNQTTHHDPNRLSITPEEIAAEESCQRNPP
eukprot:403368169